MKANEILVPLYKNIKFRSINGILLNKKRTQDNLLNIIEKYTARTIRLL
jgi:hypothetical protein